MQSERYTPWPIWAAVTILVALIGAFGKAITDWRAASSTPQSRGLDANPAPTLTGRSAVQHPGAAALGVSRVWDCDVRLTFSANDSIGLAYWLYPRPGPRSRDLDR